MIGIQISTVFLIFKMSLQTSYTRKKPKLEEVQAFIFVRRGVQIFWINSHSLIYFKSLRFLRRYTRAILEKTLIKTTMTKTRQRELLYQNFVSPYGRREPSFLAQIGGKRLYYDLVNERDVSDGNLNSLATVWSFVYILQISEVHNFKMLLYVD